MIIILGALLFIAGVGLIILGKADSSGRAKAFFRGSDTIEAAYAIACEAAIVFGVVMLFAGSVS